MICFLGLVGASPSTTAVTTEESDNAELALWGQICLRLAARPDCMNQDRMSGFLDVQVGAVFWTKILRDSL